MAGGAVGMGLPLWLSGLLAAKVGETFPVGTLAVNIIGSFIISCFAGLAGPDGPLLVSSLARQVVMVGVLGGFTTFSSFSFQRLNLLNDGQRARAQHLAGATVLKSPLGFGKNSRLHTAEILQFSTDLPMVIEIVDLPEKVEAFLPLLGAMMDGGLVTLEKVLVIHYESHNGKPS